MEEERDTHSRRWRYWRVAARRNPAEVWPRYFDVAASSWTPTRLPRALSPSSPRVPDSRHPRSVRGAPALTTCQPWIATELCLNSKKQQNAIAHDVRCNTPASSDQWNAAVNCNCLLIYDTPTNAYNTKCVTSTIYYITCDRLCIVFPAWNCTLWSLVWARQKRKFTADKIAMYNWASKARCSTATGLVENSFHFQLLLAPVNVAVVMRSATSACVCLSCSC